MVIVKYIKLPFALHFYDAHTHAQTHTCSCLQASYKLVNMKNHSYAVLYALPTLIAAFQIFGQPGESIKAPSGREREKCAKHTQPHIKLNAHLSRNFYVAHKFRLANCGRDPFWGRAGVCCVPRNGLKLFCASSW